MKFNKNKCLFYQNKVVALGYTISENLISPTDERILSLKNYSEPNTIKELRSFLGIMSYCRQVVKDLATVAAPLTDLLKGNPSSTATIKLNENQAEAFNKLRISITNESKLAISDYNSPFILTTDASGKAISGILAQKNENGGGGNLYVL